MNAASKHKTAMILLHQRTAEKNSASSAVEVKKGEAQEDKAFDNWISYCLGLGTLDKNGRFWCTKLKARHNQNEVKGILELHGDDYHVVDVTYMMDGRNDGTEFKLKPEYRQKAVIKGGRQDAIKAAQAAESPEPSSV